MKYKGFKIEKVYHCGSTFKFTEIGKLVGRKPNNDDIHYYSVIDTSNGNEWIRVDSIKEAKTDIDSLLLELKARGLS